MYPSSSQKRESRFLSGCIPLDSWSGPGMTRFLQEAYPASSQKRESRFLSGRIPLDSWSGPGMTHSWIPGPGSSPGFQERHLYSMLDSL